LKAEEGPHRANLGSFFPAGKCRITVVLSSTEAVNALRQQLYVCCRRETLGHAP